MAITYPISFPNIGIQAVNIRGQSVVGISSSPFTGQQQVYKHQGQWWEMEVTLPPMKREDAEKVAAFLLKLNGKYGTFLFGDPIASTTLGTGAGTPLVNGGSQTGDELVTDGWDADSDVLKAGDWIQLGTLGDSRLYKILDDVTSDGSGNATLNIWPSLRASPTDDQSIVVANTKGVWRMSSNSVDYSIDRASIYGITFACVEAL